MISMTERITFQLQSKPVLVTSEDEEKFKR